MSDGTNDDAAALLRQARESFLEPEPEQPAAPAPASSGRVRMYRGVPIADEPKPKAKRQRTYRGVPVDDGAPAAGGGGDRKASITAKLRKLKQLHDSGVIDAEEFSRLKAALLER